MLILPPHLKFSRFLALFTVVFWGRAANAHPRSVVYVSNADSHSISVLELDEKNGALSALETVPIAGAVMPLAISPNHEFLFASLRSAPFSVSSFRIDTQTGRLTPLKTSPLAADMAYISTDRSGKFLLGASYGGDKISVNAISAAGEVADAPLTVLATGKNAHCILTDASNRYLFASNLGADRLLQFRFDAKTGHIAPNDPPFVATRSGAGPRHFVFARSGRFVFGTNELDGTVSAYRLEKSGVLTPLGSVSAMPASTQKPWLADLHLTPDNRFLFASERTSSTLAGFAVNRKTGALTPLGHTPTETQPRGFGLDPSGKWLLAVGQKSNGLSVYRIDGKSGELRFLRRVAVGQNPNWVEIVRLR